MLCDHDFQYWTYFGVASNRSFRLGSIVTVGIRCFSTWACWALSSQMNIGNCHEELSLRDISHKSRKLLSIEDLLEDFRNFLRVVAPSFLGLENSSVVLWLDSIHPPMDLVMLDHSPLSQQVSPCFLEKKLRLAEQVPGTNTRWLLKYWAGWTETMTRTDTRFYVSMFSHLLSSLEVLWIKGSFSWYAKNTIISSATLSHKPNGLCASVADHFSSDSKSEEWPISFGKIFGIFGNTWRISITVCHCLFGSNRCRRTCLDIFRQNIEFFLHHVFDFTKELRRWVLCANLPLEHDLFGISPVQFTIRSRVSRPFNFVQPRFHRLWISCNSASKTQHGIWKDVYFCCRWLDSMFMYQSTFDPWSLIPVDRTHSKYVILLIKDQFLRDGEQGPNLGEFCVHRNT